MSSYEWREIEGYKVVFLKTVYDDHIVELAVLPDYGANILQFSYDGKKIIDFNVDKLREKDYTGTLVLFPTPNRVKNETVSFNGKDYLQLKNGKIRNCHGLVYDEKFNIDSIECESDYARISMSIDLNENNDIFKSFPFVSRLSLIYYISVSGLKIQYMFENLSDGIIPYGFGVHPYFPIKGNEIIKIPSNSFLETDNMFPTGKVLSTEQNYPELNTNGALVESLALDTDFIRNQDENIVLQFPDENMVLKVKMDKLFNHIVTYKEENGKFICVEPQTCSIDAHHMDMLGFTYSNLLYIDKGKQDKGTVELIIERKLKR